MFTYAIRSILKLIVRREDNHSVARVLIDGLDEVHTQPAPSLLLILAGELDLDGLTPARLCVSIEKLVQGAGCGQIRVVLARLGYHHCNSDAAHVPLVNRVNSTL